MARLDAFRRDHPVRFWAALAGLGAAVLGGLALRPASGGAAPSALDAFGSAAAGTTPAPSLTGGSFDPIDLVVKGGLVVVLLFVTLQVLRRLQGGEAPADARIRVIESRTLAAKTQLHLVAVGDRQVLIGATPGRLVTLAELPADDASAPDAALPELPELPELDELPELPELDALPELDDLDDEGVAPVDPARETTREPSAARPSSLRPSALILEPLDDTFAAALLHEAGLATR